LNWRTKFGLGVPLGLCFTALVVFLDRWLLGWLIDDSIHAKQISFLSFLVVLVVLLSVPLLILLIYQTLSCLTLRYRLDRNGVLVRWFGSEQVIPIRDIERILPGSQLGDTIVRRRGLRWPGHERGTGQVPGIGRTCFLATRPLPAQLVLVTPGTAFAISPHDPEEFVRAFEARRELGPNRLLEQEVHHASWFGWRIWSDQTTWALLGAAMVINLGLFGYLCARFPNLDLQLPLHFDSLGQVDRIGTRTELFALPIIGLIILGTNLILGLALYRRERAGSYLLWGTAAAVQALFWLATFSIVT
jgi:hypothetical protein